MNSRLLADVMVALFALWLECMILAFGHIAILGLIGIIPA